ncbi:adenosylcobinamide-GDP ribazoletransferase [Phocaeicola sp.]|uniref:adenosylcobinamide-GDP ribazoletransferase n=1 Tax=Phocaeicola sp. TaxID=2773926 RepID=UPI0023D220C4|nr:adenosylcobinamide-GDP ribazoletransferase [Phocaeicola sp.]MDE5676590.1 adenosylcobinamide-GDP ribazoletransferase [Phocaeicola sp.]
MKLLAALIFFTRLPFWKLANVPPVYFKRVVDYWPFVGWLTGGIMAGTLWITSTFLPTPTAVLLALASRLMVTGALHEDGLADFCDGFGGGTSREKILSIMKDSHIGTYGVLGLLFYYGLIWNILANLPISLACTAILSGDTWSKFCASQVINTLPYARKEEESKAKVVYDRMTPGTLFSTFLIGILPMLLLVGRNYWWAAIASATVFILLMSLMRKRLQGYTGDCCGATFLLCELSFYLTINLIYTNL